jgi:predicted hotdog family 3-hydroxylacyl-ACP dehydratase
MNVHHGVAAMLLDKAALSRLIPHTGDMCLLDGVLYYDSTCIRCVSRTHLQASNPMFRRGRLPALCGVEYAAQAMAVHGGLNRIASVKPRAGYLASLRDVYCRVERLDDLSGDLLVYAEQLMENDTNVMYEFKLWSDTQELLSGRATVMLVVDRASA